MDSQPIRDGTQALPMQADVDELMGCGHYVLGYCLACYALSSVLFFLSGGEVHFYWVLFAPLIFPAMLFLALMLIGNPVLPMNPIYIFWVLLIFTVFFVASVALIRLSLVRLWLSFTIAGLLLGYLVIVAIFSA